MLKTSRLKLAPELKTSQKIDFPLKKLATDMMHIAATLSTLLCKNVLAWSTNAMIGGLYYTNIHKFIYKHITCVSYICRSREKTDFPLKKLATDMVLITANLYALLHKMYHLERISCTVPSQIVVG
jgi:hypothetical protein